MGIFDRWKKKRKSNEYTELFSTSTPSTTSSHKEIMSSAMANTVQKMYEEALQLMSSDDYRTQCQGRVLLEKVAKSPFVEDPIVYLQMAKVYDEAHVFHQAAYWYKKAYQAGFEDAREHYVRCSNPYHIDAYFNLDGSRGCGTFYFSALEKTKAEHKKDFNDALAALNNDPTPEVIKKSVETIRLIAEGYNCRVPEAQVWWGDFCEHVIEDLETATHWYKTAAENKSIEGARCYADMLMAGRGVEKNVEEAIKYYTMAADGGHAEAQYILGVIYQSQNDIENALKYYRDASNNGYEQATIKIEEIEDDEDSSMEKYRQKLTNKFASIVSANGFDDGGLVEFYADIYNPNTFCEKAYEYCSEHYARFDDDKMIFEYCMTAFYGCICSTVIWANDTEVYSDGSVWDGLYKQINVEFTDSNAERLLGTKNGEEKAEKIYELIHDYIKLAMAIIKANQLDKELCLYAMSLAYKLGMLVAMKEVSVAGADTVKELMCSEQSEDTLKTPQKFYSECLLAFHNEAQKFSFANKGLIFIPELIPIGEKTVLSYLKDDYFVSAFGNNVKQYYYVIMSLALQSGIVFGEKWHDNFDELNNGYVEEIIDEGPADVAAEILKDIFDLVDSQVQNDYYNSIYDVWLKQCNEYLQCENPEQYIFVALVAAYQLGVSMILEKHGY